MIEREPSVKKRIGRPPGEGSVVAVPHRQNTARAQHPSQLAEGGYGFGQVLEHLVRMDDVEGFVPEFKAVDVSGRELDIGHAALAT